LSKAGFNPLRSTARASCSGVGSGISDVSISSSDREARRSHSVWEVFEGFPGGLLAGLSGMDCSELVVEFGVDDEDGCLRKSTDIHYLFAKVDTFYPRIRIEAGEA